MGPKYRENYNILWEKGKASITERPYGVTNMTLINLSAQNGRKKSEASLIKKWKKTMSTNTSGKYYTHFGKRNHYTL